MALGTTGTQSATAPRRWLYGLWAYYREYTHTAVHAASAAGLTAFGLLVFVDPLFVVLAIASYVGPPLVLYTIDSDVGRPTEPSADRSTGPEPRSNPDHDGDRGPGDRDQDADHSDTDADTDDGDSDGADVDTDGTDGDTDSDG